MIPKIELRYSRIYDEMFRYSKDTKEILKKKRKKYPAQSKIKKYIKEITPLWKKHEKEILKKISKVSGLKWKEKKIIIYIVGLCKPFSDPLTIKPHKHKNYFIDTLTHELIHQIQIQSCDNWKKWWRYLEKKYKKESILTKCHILLHAVHWKILTEIFNEKRLKENIQRHKKFKDYKRAWEIVEKESYSEIIKKFRKITK